MKKKVIMIVGLFSLLIAGLSGIRVYGTRAMLNPSDGVYVSDFSTAEIGVEVYENGESAEGKELFSGLGDIDPGKLYEEIITVKNTKEEPEYVRVIVKKYWVDAQGEKNTELSPSLIQLPLANDSWFENEKEKTNERSVYYLKDSLQGGAESPVLFEGLVIDKSIAKSYKTETSEDGKVITVTYIYDNDNASFTVEVEAQSIQVPQENNEAILSVWGVTNINASGGKLSLK